MFDASYSIPLISAGLLTMSGLLIIAVMLYVRSLVSRSYRSVLKLIKMNEEINYDPQEFLKNTRHFFEDINVADYAFELRMFGNSTNKVKTTLKKGIQKSFLSDDDDYYIFIEIVPRRHTERKYMNRIILEVIFLLVKLDVLMKIKAANESFVNMAKLQTLVLHDIRNLAQFMYALMFNIKDIKTKEEESRLIAYMKESSSALFLRIKRIMGVLEISIPKEPIKSVKEELKALVNEKTDINLTDMVKTLLDIYKIPHEISGGAYICEKEEDVMLVFDNLFKNIYDKYLNDETIRCYVEIQEIDTRVQVAIEDTGKHISGIEHIFEPFYTTKSGNLGVGLFYIRGRLKSMNGTIEAENTESGVRFIITLPLQHKKSHL